MRDLFELLFCPIHGLFRPDNLNAMLVSVDSQFYQTSIWIKYKIRELMKERRSKLRTNSTLRRIMDITFTQIRKDQQEYAKRNEIAPWKEEHDIRCVESQTTERV